MVSTSISPSLALLHELGHIYLRITKSPEKVREEAGVPFGDIGVPLYDTPEDKWIILQVEHPAVDILNKIDGNSKEFKRTTHEGGFFETKEVNSTDPVDPTRSIDVYKNKREVYLKEEKTKEKKSK